MPHRIIWSWYTGRWCVSCYIWYSEEGPGWTWCLQNPTGALPLDPAERLLSPRPSETWNPQAQKASYAAVWLTSRRACIVRLVYNAANTNNSRSSWPPAEVPSFPWMYHSVPQSVRLCHQSPTPPTLITSQRRSFMSSNSRRRALLVVGVAPVADSHLIISRLSLSLGHFFILSRYDDARRRRLWKTDDAGSAAGHNICSLSPAGAQWKERPQQPRSLHLPQ